MPGVWTKKGRPRPKPSIFHGLTGPGVTDNTAIATTTTTTATTKGKTPTTTSTPKKVTVPAAGLTKKNGVGGNTQPTTTKKTGRKLLDKTLEKAGKANILEKKLENAGKTNILSLQEHNLEAIPSQVFEIKTLKTLDVSHNRIKRLDNQLTGLKDLKSLNVDQNRLTPGTLAPISSLTKLQTLSAGGNKLGQQSTTSTLASLPSTLPASLKQIKLDNNGFMVIPRQILQANILPKLEKLDLSFNNLSSIPPAIEHLVALTQLNLDNNKITKLPTTIGKLDKLKSLSLKNNQIRAAPVSGNKNQEQQSLPKSLFVDTPLVDLNLHGNPMTSTQLNNNFVGYSTFLERREKIKSKDVYGGALTDLDVCGLK